MQHESILSDSNAPFLADFYALPTSASMEYAYSIAYSMHSIDADVENG
jgi:hypothetical protein